MQRQVRHERRNLPDSMIDNLKELLDLVPDLNITADPVIAQVSEQAKDLIVSPDILRDNDKARKANAEKAKMILGAFGNLKNLSQ